MPLSDSHPCLSAAPTKCNGPQTLSPPRPRHESRGRGRSTEMSSSKSPMSPLHLTAAPLASLLSSPHHQLLCDPSGPLHARQPPCTNGDIGVQWWYWGAVHFPDPPQRLGPGGLGRSQGARWDSPEAGAWTCGRAARVWLPDRGQRAQGGQAGGRQGAPRPRWKPLRSSASARPPPIAACSPAPHPGRSAQGRDPGVTWGCGGAPPPPGGRRVAPAAARGPGRRATPPRAGRSGTVRGLHHPSARGGEEVCEAGCASPGPPTPIPA